MSDKVICIAGKNSIAINTLSYVLDRYPQYKVLACINRTDNYNNNWQKSFGRYCHDKNIEIVELQQLYNIRNLYLFSLEFDRLIDTRKFTSNKLFNIHFSLLPAYKGMYTSALPILHNEKETGVTLHLIDNGIDTGDIIAQEKILIDNDLNCRDLYLSYLKIGEALVIQNLDKLISNNFTAIVQSSNGSSYYSKNKIDYENIIIDLNKTAIEIACQIRAFSFREYQLPTVLGYAIYKAFILESRSFSKPGTLLREDTISITISSVDYDVRLMKDQLRELHEAAHSGDLRKIQDIYASGYDITVKDANGWDVLIIASYNGSFDVVKWIIDNELLNINTRNFKGTTAVMYAMTYATKSKDKSILEYLILNGADLKLVDQNNLDIFNYAKEYDFELFKDLLKYAQ